MTSVLQDYERPTRGHAPALSVAVQRHHTALVLEVAGEVDIRTAPQLSQALQQALRERPLWLVLDLSKVEFLTSAGLAVLLAGHQQAGAHTHLRIVASERGTLRPIEITGLHQVLALYASRDDALG